MARRIETELLPLIGGDLADAPAAEPEVIDAHDAPALLAAARRKREQRDARQPKPPSTRRRRVATPIPDPDADPLSHDTTPGGSALDGIPAGPGGMFSRAGINPWTATALVVMTALAVLSLVAVGDLPKPLAVSNISVSWLPGPRVPDAEVLAWLRRCPQFDKLSEPNEWVLEKLAEHLRSLPAVAEVRQVRMYHEPAKIQAVRRVQGKAPVLVQVDGLRRTVEIQIALRQPYLPAVLKDGSRVWIDATGVILPGILPSPGVQRPLVRQLEGGGLVSVKAAVALWQRLEPLLEKGLVSDILLNDPLETVTVAAPGPGQPVLSGPPAAPGQPALSGQPRGIVLTTRQGARLVWGRAGEERFGVQPEDKVRDLVHTLKCQGDLSRIDSVNVRFHEPFYSLRNATVPH